MLFLGPTPRSHGNPSRLATRRHPGRPRHPVRCRAMPTIARWLAAVAALLAVAATGSAQPAPADPPKGADSAQRSAAPGRVGVLTFNIRYGTAPDKDNAWPRRREQVFDILRDERLDVAGLQEALRAQLDDIHGACPGWAEVGVGRDDGKQAGEYAAILYRADRWRAGRSGTFWLSETPERPASKSWNTAVTRVCTWARLERIGEGRPRVLWVFNTHLDHVSSQARVEGVKLIAARIAARGDAEPFILTGDFNAGENDPAIAVLTGEAHAAGPTTTTIDAPTATNAAKPVAVSTTAPAASPIGPVVDTYRAVHPDEKTVGTFNAFDPAKTTGPKIDYIWTQRGAKVTDAWIDRRTKDGRTPSDHFPVGAILDFAP